MIQSVWKNLTGLIPAEHLWCDFKCRPWAKNSSLYTKDLYIHYMDKSTGTSLSLEEKKTLPNCGNKYGNIIHVHKNCISTSVATVLKCMKWLYTYVQVIVFVFIKLYKYSYLKLLLSVELSSLCGVVLRHGSSTNESNVLKSMWVTAPVWILCLGITDYSLRLGI